MLTPKLNVVQLDLSDEYSIFVNPDKLSSDEIIVCTNLFVHVPLVYEVLSSYFASYVGLFGAFLSIFPIFNSATTLFPAISVASACTVPFSVAVIVVALAVNVLPIPAFLFFDKFFPYVTVTVTFLFVQSVVLGTKAILLSSKVFSPIVNTFDTFVSALFPAASKTFTHK